MHCHVLLQLLLLQLLPVASAGDPKPERAAVGDCSKVSRDDTTPSLRLLTSGHRNAAGLPAMPKLPSPPMGWSAWNTFGTNINETLILQTAEALVASGMAAAGYEYVKLDDGWWEGAGTGRARRNATGFLIADPARFPSGLKRLADKIHALGLKFGLYSDAGAVFCSGDRPAGQGFERQDARLFASVGADYVKVDACGLDNSPEVAEAAARTWSAELAAAGRPMVFSNCHIGCMLSDQRRGGWAPWCSALAHLWRSSRDIHSVWCEGPGPDSCRMGVMHNLDSVAGSADKAGPTKGWNDPDMLEVGTAGLTDTESRAHFTMWCVISAPLIAGNDVRGMSRATLGTLTNAEAIAVNQAWAGGAGDRLGPANVSGTETWVKPLRKGCAAFALLNRQDAASADVSLPLDAMGSDRLACSRAGGCIVRDLWQHCDVGRFSDTYMHADIPPHGAALLLVRPRGIAKEDCFQAPGPETEAADKEAISSDRAGAAAALAR